MKYLLDTHTAIWALGDTTKLSETAKAIFDDISIPLYISIISAWEIAIKASIGKLNYVGGAAFFLDKMQINGVELLNIASAHLTQVENMPFFHRDPFDRLLIATAKVEGMTVITADENISKYDIPVVW